MPSDHLDALLRPRSIALIGASDTPGTIGKVLASNLLGGAFQGPVMPVNPRHDSILGTRAYADIAQLPETPDLAVICTPPASVPGIVEALGARGGRAAVILTAGFAEDREARGSALQRELVEAARRHRLRVCGPNCVGIQVPGIGLNASFAPTRARPGNIGFVAQSGAVITSLLDRAESRGIGFSHLVSLGDMADLDFGDMLDYLARDPGTRAILLYIESIGDASGFMAAARAASRIKPVVALKAGRHAEGARAVVSHTGAMAGSDAVCQAAFERAGILRVSTLAALFDAAETLERAPPPRGDRVAILTNGGGAGVLAADALIEAGGRLADLSAATRQALDAALPRTWSHGNPVDLIGDAGPDRYAKALDALRSDPGVDAILALHCPTAVSSPVACAEPVIAAASADDGPPILASWVGGNHVAEGRRLLADHGVPSYDTPEQAADALMLLARWRGAQSLPVEAPPIPRPSTPDQAAARALITAALGAGRGNLTAYEAGQVIAAWGVPVVETRTATTPEAAAAIAADVGGPVALKVLSGDIVHKSDAGGVALDLDSPTTVLESARLMLARIPRAHPNARIQGLAVQPMVHRAGARELIVGAVDDAQFGPVILVGHGGTEAEAIDDKALGLPPLSLSLARELLSRTRIYRLLQGVRGRPPADLDAIAMTLVRVAQLVTDIPAIRELDINPLLADAGGVMALDARIALSSREQPAAGITAKR
jgi:acetyltransferase